MSWSRAADDHRRTPKQSRGDPDRQATAATNQQSRTRTCCCHCSNRHGRLTFPGYTKRGWPGPAWSILPADLHRGDEKSLQRHPKKKEKKDLDAHGCRGARGLYSEGPNICFFAEPLFLFLRRRQMNNTERQQYHLTPVPDIARQDSVWHPCARLMVADPPPTQATVAQDIRGVSASACLSFRGLACLL